MLPRVQPNVTRSGGRVLAALRSAAAPPPKEPAKEPEPPPEPLSLEDYLCRPAEVDALMDEDSLPTDVNDVGAGLDNLGNTCYFNSIVQCLIHTLPLANYFLGGMHSKTCGFRRSQQPCVACHFEQLVTTVLRCKNASPRDFLIRNLKQINKSFVVGRQEDSHELMRCLLEAIEKGVLSQYGNPKEIKGRVAETTAVGQMFGGRLRSQVHCLDCGHDSNTLDSFLDLSLELPREVQDLEAALRYFTRPETLDRSNKYKCERCKNYVQARKQFLLAEAPRVLCVHLKRFEFAFMAGGKISRRIAFPELLDLAPFLTPEARAASRQAFLYRLYALNVHIGSSTNSGHYYSYVRPLRGRDGQQRWVLLDDSARMGAQPNDVRSAPAYLLFFQRLPHAAAPGAFPGPSPAAASSSSGPLKRPREEPIGPQLPPAFGAQSLPHIPLKRNLNGPLPGPFATSPATHRPEASSSSSSSSAPAASSSSSSGAARVAPLSARGPPPGAPPFPPAFVAASSSSAPPSFLGTPRSGAPSTSRAPGGRPPPLPPLSPPAKKAKVEERGAAEAAAARAATGQLEALAAWRELARAELAAYFAGLFDRGAAGERGQLDEAAGAAREGGPEVAELAEKAAAFEEAARVAFVHEYPAEVEALVRGVLMTTEWPRIVEAELRRRLSEEGHDPHFFRAVERGLRERAAEQPEAPEAGALLGALFEALGCARTIPLPDSFKELLSHKIAEAATRVQTSLAEAIFTHRRLAEARRAPAHHPLPGPSVPPRPPATPPQGGRGRAREPREPEGDMFAPSSPPPPARTPSPPPRPPSGSTPPRASSPAPFICAHTPSPVASPERASPGR
eukprot:tig00000808_g4433.t1